MQIKLVHYFVHSPNKSPPHSSKSRRTFSFFRKSSSYWELCYFKVPSIIKFAIKSSASTAGSGEVTGKDAAQTIEKPFFSSSNAFHFL